VLIPGDYESALLQLTRYIWNKIKGSSWPVVTGQYKELRCVTERSSRNENERWCLCGKCHGIQKFKQPFSSYCKDQKLNPRSIVLKLIVHICCISQLLWFGALEWHHDVQAMMITWFRFWMSTTGLIHEHCLVRWVVVLSRYLNGAEGTQQIFVLLSNYQTLLGCNFESVIYFLIELLVSWIH
jgi:hypothetical protein